MSKRLVELMGGLIGVESTVGLGSVFWFELNSASCPAWNWTWSSLRRSPKRQVHNGALLRTLLYVEDNPANLKLVEQLIARRPDMRLLSATRRQPGRPACAREPPGGDPDGHQSSWHQRHRSPEDPARRPGTAHIPVVALSANAMPRDIEKGLQAGFFRYLTKPIKVNEFMDTLDVALEFAEQESQTAKLWSAPTF